MYIRSGVFFLFERVLNSVNNPRYVEKVWYINSNIFLSVVWNIPLYATYIIFQLAVQCLRCLFSSLSLPRPGLYPRSIHVISVEDTVAKRQVFLCLLQLFPVNIIQAILRTHLHLRVVNWRTKRGELPKAKLFQGLGSVW